MIASIIVFSVCVLLVIVGVILYYVAERNCNYSLEPIATILLGIGICVGLVIGVLFPQLYFGAKQYVANFASNKAYIENHVSKNSIEDATITNTKIEWNSSLFAKQNWYKSHPYLSFYDETILELEPID